MGSIHELLKDVPIPRLAPVRQIFDASHLEDVAAEARRELARPAVVFAIEPGMSVAITAGSRGIDQLAVVIREVVSFLKERGAKPFVIPAMGSHGAGEAGRHPWLWRHGGKRGMPRGGDHVGKDISGEGMDPNIAGRWIVPTIQGGIDACRIGILDITDETLGNVVGLGMADTCSRRVVERMSRENTYPNSLTSTVTCLCKIPMYFDTQKETIQATIKMTPAKLPEEVTMIRIASTLAMDTIYVSENLLDEVAATPGMEILGEPEALVFDENGDLF